MAAGDVEVVFPKTRAFKCAVFDGVDDYVDTTPTINLSNGLTMSARINIKGWGEGDLGNIISMGANRPSLRLSKFGIRGFSFFTEGGSERVTAVDSVNLNMGWTHILVTANATTNVYTGYINGVVSGTPGTSGDIDALDITLLRIGNIYTGTTRTFDGSIADVRIYNRVLSTTEITSLAGNGDVRDGLVGEWRLRDDYKDTSGNGNDGTNSGSILATIEDQVATEIKDARVTANDTFLISAGENGQVYLASIEEAP